MPGQAWTVERIDLLRTLWAEGKTATAIAARLGGMSRSAVLGKVFRLRLGIEGGEAAAPAQKRVRANERSEAAGRFARRRGGKADNRPQFPPAARQGKTLLELTNDSCRWPYRRPGTNKFFFCGAAGANLERGIPYCARHMRRAYPTLERIVAEDSRGALRGSGPFAHAHRLRADRGHGRGGGDWAKRKRPNRAGHPEIQSRPGLTPQAYGRLVHEEFADEVQAAVLPGIAPTDVETTWPEGWPYGSLDSVRTDVVLRDDNGTIIAIYDVKTGQSGLTPARIAELLAKTGAPANTWFIELRPLGAIIRKVQVMLHRLAPR